MIYGVSIFKNHIDFRKTQFPNFIDSRFSIIFVFNECVVYVSEHSNVLTGMQDSRELEQFPFGPLIVCGIFAMGGVKLIKMLLHTILFQNYFTEFPQCIT